MKLRISHVLVIILIVCCSFSCVAATGDNETLIADGNDYDIAAAETDLNVQDEPMALDDSSSQAKDVYGIVDLGSNVLSLHIYNENTGKLENVLTENKDSVTAKYKQNNMLTQEGIDQLIIILDDYDRLMDSNNVTVKYFFATASLRKIDNTDEVVTAVKDSLGIDLHVLTGEDEARVGFNAVKFTDLTENEGLLIDLGGGSCEVTPFVNKTPVTSESMPIGSLSCFNEYVSSLFPNETEIIDIRNRVDLELSKLSVNTSSAISDLYGTGGTIYTIKQTLIHLGYIDNETYVIPVSTLDLLLGRLLENTTQAFDIISEVAASRVNTLVPGMVITKKISDCFQVKYIHFCRSELEEGIVYELINNQTQDSQADDEDANETADDIASGDDIPSVVDVLSQDLSPSVQILEMDNTAVVGDDSNSNETSAMAKSASKDTGDLAKSDSSYAIPIVAVLLCAIVAVAVYRKRE